MVYFSFLIFLLASDDIQEEELVDDPAEENERVLPMARKSLPKKGKGSKKFGEPVPCGIGKCTVSVLILKVCF